jgi:hypothetical protein
MRRGNVALMFRCRCAVGVLQFTLGIIRRLCHLNFSGSLLMCARYDRCVLARESRSRSQSSQLIGSIPLLRSSYLPNDHTDNQYGSYYPVAKHTSLQWEDPRIQERCISLDRGPWQYLFNLVHNRGNSSFG